MTAAKDGSRQWRFLRRRSHCRRVVSKESGEQRKRGWGDGGKKRRMEGLICKRPFAWHLTSGPEEPRRHAARTKASIETFRIKMCSFKVVGLT